MRSAVYAGTFDPFTRGHLSVVERGAQLFDRLCVLVAVNPQKNPLFSAAERVDMIRQAAAAPWPNVEVAFTTDYVVHFAQAWGARYLIRGVRGATDIDAEIELATLNHQLAPEIESVFVPAHAGLAEVSSSRLKALIAKGEDVSGYCPVGVEARLKERILARELGATEAPSNQ